MNRQQRIAAALLAAGMGLLAAAFLFLATAPPEVEQVVARAPQPVTNAVKRKAKRRWRGGGKVRAEAAVNEEIQLPEDGVAPTTDSCRYIVDERRRGVHAFIVMDNIRDQGMRFEQADVACLTAAGVDESLVRYAEFDMNSRMLDEDQQVGIR
jgi:hypothetical protein